MDPLRIALLTSRTLPVAAQILADPNRGATWNLALVADDELSLDALAHAEPHYLFVCGYEHEIPQVVLDDYRGRIFTIQETRSFLYAAAEDGGRGPLFLLGPPYPNAAAMILRALELLAGGAAQVLGDVMWVDGAPAPCRMGHSPDACHEPETHVTRGIPSSCPFIGGVR